MNIKNLKYCPSTLSEGFNTYSPTALKKMFNGKKVNHILPFASPGKSEATRKKFMENRNRISISGVQEKISLVLDGNNLRLTNEGEHGQYILKVIPHDLENIDTVPANEHVTMQIAAQVFKLKTAENALIFFDDGKLAYITRRFDIDEKGNKKSQEDFASLAKKTKENTGDNYKYSGSYEDIATLIKKYIVASKTELDRFYRVVLFNYLFSNGDAHLKNFSVLETPNSDHILSPMYDLLCTRLHVDDSYLALNDGLFSKDFETPSYKANGYLAYDDFYEFGKKLHLPENRILNTLEEFIRSEEKVKEMVKKSFLNTNMKKEYLRLYKERLSAISYSYKAINK